MNAVKPKKLFTPKEANQRLPLVRRIVSDILRKGDQLRATLAQPDQPQRAQRCAELTDDIRELMAELEELGCYYKDWDFSIGLVDFPAVIDDKTVLLCWRSDEDSVRWYHPVEEGYAGRRPIPEDVLEN